MTEVLNKITVTNPISHNIIQFRKFENETMGLLYYPPLFYSTISTQIVLKCTPHKSIAH